MLLAVAYSRAARRQLWNTCDAHPGCVVDRFGRAVLFRETEFSALQVLRLRARHGGHVAVKQTAPFNEFKEVPERIRTAAEAYEGRASRSTPYRKFASGTEHPDPEGLRGVPL
ncbi:MULTISPECIES: hypothetical protein [Halobacterium]|uniref:DUF7855 family protein n=1 Tax=Halobacterium TaxID=2239 RepID=UPI00196660B5|nr:MULTISPECIES: hypothetical protein [Halobacterium]MDL0123456.1 hypothetical protein [Halobacterium salinarum]MDL0128547.1 hypothetical protein [Halobacterium salinarum]MDL0133307.1 hypothetical protein [Halobacterium salinarum]QRY22367.1 hypothetical protein JT689_10155 [Halobacterium sp. GSL-19]QRY24445.1 hypothetical protein JRZ79_08530 [Halobacterium sp. BOL4-2]